MSQATSIAGYVALFGAMYAAFGAASPFLPSLMEARGIPPEQIGTIFAIGTAARLVSSPAAGRIADRTGALRATLAVSAAGTSFAVLGYVWAQGFWMILAVSVMHAVWLAPAANLADALAQRQMALPKAGIRGGSVFEYGWVRGSGSAAFVAGSLLAGAAIANFGLDVIVWMQAFLMLVVPLALTAIRSPGASAAGNGDAPPNVGNGRRAIVRLIKVPGFFALVAVVALILGSHAMHDTFSVIRWRASGLSAPTISLLWSLAVAAEVAVFTVLGPWALDRVSPVAALRIAAVVAAMRWAISAWSVAPAALVLVQPMHGVTFAFLHLAAMRLLASIVPAELAATAQALYGTVGIGLTSVAMTFASGLLIAATGYGGFLFMSALSLASLPVTLLLARQLDGKPVTSRQAYPRND